METRSIHELLIELEKLVREDRNENCREKMGTFGLCVLIYNNSKIFNIREEKFLLNYLSENRPKRAKDLDMDWGMFWQPCKIAPRLRWIRRHIKLTKPN